MCTQSETGRRQGPWLTFEQLVVAIKDLDEPALRRVADVVDETRRQIALYAWLKQPGAFELSGGNEPTNTIIEAEISAVLQLGG